MDLPIYSNSMLRSSLQFADLNRMKGPDTAAVWEKADKLISAMEGAAHVAQGRAILKEFSKNTLRDLHAILFEGRDGAGHLRASELRPLYRGQDCAPPEFIDRSLENLIGWIGAESFNEIHPIEKCALTITRIVDIWPFEFGNLTTALVFANSFLDRSGLTPFYVQPVNMGEFEGVIAQSLAIETQPLVNAIYATVRREMEALAKG